MGSCTAEEALSKAFSLCACDFFQNGQDKIYRATTLPRGEVPGHALSANVPQSLASTQAKQRRTTIVQLGPPFLNMNLCPGDNSRIAPIFLNDFRPTCNVELWRYKAAVTV